MSTIKPMDRIPEAILPIPKLDFRRQTGIFDPELFNTRIGIVGCGGIGASTVTILAKMGIRNIEVWDHDDIEEYNIPSQFLPLTPGLKKVDGLKEMIKYLTGIDIDVHPEKFDEQSLAGRLAPTIMIMAVDDMDIRKMIYESCLDSIGVDFIIDGRMSGESYTIVAENGETYMDSWHPEPEEAIPCTEKAIIYNTMSIGSDIANTVKKYLLGQPVPKIVKCDMRTYMKITGEDYKWLIHRKQ